MSEVIAIFNVASHHQLGWLTINVLPYIPFIVIVSTHLFCLISSFHEKMSYCIVEQLSRNVKP